MATSSAEIELRAKTREKLLQLIQESVDRVNNADATAVRALAEAYAFVVGTSS
jgi:hypothetical protein